MLAPRDGYALEEVMTSAENPLFPTRHILVGVSFSDPAEDDPFQLCASDHAPIRQAVWLAGHTNAEITFFHVLENVPDDIDPTLAKTYADIHQRATWHVDKVAQKFREQGLVCHTKVTHGISWEQTILEAVSSGCDLVVVGPRRQGAGLLDRIVYGSTTNRLIRQCPLPVWVVAPEAATGISHIVVPIDFSPASERCVAFADWLSHLANAECTAVHSLEYKGFFSLRPLPQTEESVEKFQEKARQDAEDKLRGFLGAKIDQWKAVIDEDRIERALPRVVSQSGADLVILATQGAKGLPGILLGTTAEKVLSRCVASVLVIKPVGFEAPMRSVISLTL